jgi:hypothetical protein
MKYKQIVVAMVVGLALLADCGSSQEVKEPIKETGPCAGGTLVTHPGRQTLGEETWWYVHEPSGELSFHTREKPISNYSEVSGEEMGVSVRYESSYSQYGSIFSINDIKHKPEGVWLNPDDVTPGEDHTIKVVKTLKNNFWESTVLQNDKKPYNTDPIELCFENDRRNINGRNWYSRRERR